MSYKSPIKLIYSRLVLFFAVILTCGIDAAAQGVRIYKKNGTVIDITSSQLDSIVIVPAREFVDMGLSVRWASCNVGAEKPEEYGSYFAWGDITPKTAYCKEAANDEISRMIDISGSAQFDAARASWGEPARMPTNDEMNELFDNCRWYRMTYSGVSGMLATGPSGNSIFFPLSGFRVSSSLFGDGQFGYYWTSTAFESDEDDAFFLNLNQNSYSCSVWVRRYIGCTVRAVADL